MPTNKKLTLSITNEEDIEAIEVLRRQLEAKTNNKIRYSLRQVILIAVNNYLDIIALSK